MFKMLNKTTSVIKNAVTNHVLELLRLQQTTHNTVFRDGSMVLYHYNIHIKNHKTNDYFSDGIVVVFFLIFNVSFIEVYFLAGNFILFS